MAEPRPMSSPVARSAYAWLRQYAKKPSDGHEAVALAVHAILLYHDFRPSTEAPSEEGENQVPTNLPGGWGGAGYGGQYRHVRSAMLFDIRAVRMGGRLVVHAAAGEDDSRMHTVDVRVADFYTPDSPGESRNIGRGEGGAESRDDDVKDENQNSVRSGERSGNDEGGDGNQEDAKKSDRSGDNDGRKDQGGNEGGQSEDNKNDSEVERGGDGDGSNDDVWDRLKDLDGLATLVAVQIAHRLVPESAKRGYEDGAGSSGADASDGPMPTATPVPMPGPRPVPVPMPIPAPDGDHENPLYIGPPHQPRMPGVPGMPLGHDDLLPAGLPRPLGGSGGMFGPGGNLMGPGHFQPQGGPRLPPGVPPGARFDPYAPAPDPDMEMPPGFEDEHNLRRGAPPSGRGGLGRGGFSRGGGRGGFGDGGAPPGMYF